MANVFEATSVPWRVLFKSFQDALAQRVEASLEQQTTLAVLDLRPNCKRQAGVCCPPGAMPASGGVASDIIALRKPREALDATPTAYAAATSARGGDAAVRQAAGCMPAAAATVLEVQALPRLEEALAPGPSPAGVLSPVSPPSSRRSSLSASALSASGLRRLHSEPQLNSEGLSTLSDRDRSSAGAVPAGDSGSNSYRRQIQDQGQHCAAREEIKALAEAQAPACGAQQMARPIGVGMAPGQGSATVLAQASASGPQLQLPQRRPATLRLRCIVRDPQTGSMLATARGHVDDADLPLRRPRGRQRPPPVRGDVGGTGAGGGSGAEGRFEEPGHLLLLEEAVLGRGAFGFVTLVTDAVTEQPYALKRLRRSSVSAKHVMQEQQALRLLVRDQLAPTTAVSDWHRDKPQQQQQQGPGICKRCGGLTGPATDADDATPSAVSSFSGAAGPQRVAGGRCAAAAAAAAVGQLPPRPCQCRFCTSSVVTAGSRNQGGGGAAAAPSMGPARAAWLAKQRARGLLGLPLQPQRPCTERCRQQPQPQPQAEQPQVQRCCCRRRRRGASFCVCQLGTFQDEHYLYLLMEHCPGGDLDRLVRSLTRKTLVPRTSWLAQVVAGPKVAWRGLTEAAARFYAAGILLALEELHSHYIVYRDLKPGNVLIDGAGYPRLADFGMAKALGGPTGRATSACGTLDYMAPEIVKLECEQLAREGRAQGLGNWVDSGALKRGLAPAAGSDAAAGGAADGGRKAQAAVPPPRGRRRREDGAQQGTYGLGVDWWSYGSVLYVLLTGCKPFCPPEAEEAGENPTRVLVRIINPWYEVPLPLYLSPAARDLLRRLLVRQPKWRLGCGGGGADEVRSHPFFAGFDWDAFEERRMAPPYPPKAVSLPHDQEAQSVACFFGFCGSSLMDTPAKPPQAPGQQPPQQQQQQGLQEGQGSDPKRLQQQQQALPANWLHDF